MTHAELIHIAYRWLLNKAGCGVAFHSLVAVVNEQPDVIGFGGKVESILVECKVSRADFLADRKKPFRLQPEAGMGTHRIYCCPEGLLQLEELPAKWALLSVNARGRCQLTYRPDPEKPGAFFLTSLHKQANNRDAERDFMYSALRRLQLKGVVKEILPSLAKPVGQLPEMP